MKPSERIKQILFNHNHEVVDGNFNVTATIFCQALIEYLDEQYYKNIKFQELYNNPEKFQSVILEE